MNVSVTNYESTVQGNSVKKARVALLLLFPVTGISSYIASNIYYYAGISLPVLYIWIAVYFAHAATKELSGISSLSRFSMLPLGLALLFIIAKFRAFLFDSSIISIVNVFYTVTFYTGVYLLARLWAKHPDSFDFVSLLLKSFSLYFFINGTLWIFGVRNYAFEGFYTGELDPLFSFLPGRQIFPLSQGITDSSVCAMLGAVSTLLLFKNLGETNGADTHKRKKVFYIAGICIGVLFIFLTGNRLPLVFFAFICLYVGLRLHRYKKITMSICVALFLFPFLYLLLLVPLMETNILDHLESFSRTGDPLDVLLLSNRVIIWMVELLHFLNDADFMDLLFGYGYFGQTISGIVYDYGYLFDTSYASSELAEVHSTILQIIIDSGIAGALLFISIIFIYLKRAYLIDDERSRTAPLIIFMALIGTSMIEVQLASDCQAFLFFILLTTYYLSMQKTIVNEPLRQVSEVYEH